MEQGKSIVNAKGKAQAGQTPARLKTEVTIDGGLVRSSEETSVMGVERRDEVIELVSSAAPSLVGSKTVMESTRVIPISKKMVWSSYTSLKRKGEKASGIDGVSLQGFEEKLKMNLYKVWNRLSSGSYQAPPILRVGIRKGKTARRHLGLPTLSDRIAQGVCLLYTSDAADE